jgi:hypothetical protein
MRAGRLAPVAGLFVLAPLVGEYLLGNVSVVQLRALPILALMYGGGAILIREMARRNGLGWPGIITLGAAYGLLEAGVIDQTLFNPPVVAGVDQGGSSSLIPALGFKAGDALAFIGGHAVWSIGVPIAVVEALTPGRRRTPWLGTAGLLVTGVLYLAGSVIIFRFMYRMEGFMAPVPNRLGAAAVAVGLIVLVLALRRRPRAGVGRATAGRRLPGPRLVGVIAFAGSSLFFLKSESWGGVAYGVVVATAMALLLLRWSRHPGWGPAHELAVAGGTMLTYAWGGFLLTFLLGRGGGIHYAGNALFAAGAVALLLIATRRVRRVAGHRPATPEAAR